jgi:predicted nucleic-acid-binding protein
MIGLDTNVLVRLLTNDDRIQARQARDYLARNCSANSPAFVSNVALAETFWVLRSVYGLAHDDIASAFSTLFAIREITFEDDEAAKRAWQAYVRSGADFADFLIGAVDRAHGCDATITFDRKAAKLEGFRLLS